MRCCGYCRSPQVRPWLCPCPCHLPPEDEDEREWWAGLTEAQRATWHRDELDYERAKGKRDGTDK